ncbi:DEKNAAC105255 [Brettanomyces naardenensis]|uniref:DEKNAAC105255 n=1 Tax=Brettanomyces naardenensis TaxID=13370 RepID=A0A448YSX9_BRENA|nr:DEKNAAC105255 [Brettanomyces naardenensis]
MPYNLLALGSNGGYQLGVGDNKDRHSAVPSEFEINGEIQRNIGGEVVQVACGGEHTLLLLADGHLLASGSNEQSQLFSSVRKTSDHFKVFRTIESLADRKFKLVSCGWEYSVAITTDDKILVSGYGPNGELGLGKPIMSTKGADDGYTAIPFEEAAKRGGIKKIKGSIHSTIIQLGNGEVWGWGNNKKGQLFDTDGELESRIVWKPTLLEFRNHAKVLDFAMARDFSVFILRDQAGVIRKVFRGKDNYDIGDDLHDVRLDEDTLENIQAMWTSVHVITKDKSIRSFGNNSHSQISPRRDVHPDKYRMGSEHGLCIVDERKVFAWGWGEHGNCGEHSDDKKEKDDVTFDYCNEIYEAGEGERVVNVFGGCATSFIEVERKNS